MAKNKKSNITRARKIRDAGKTPLQNAQVKAGRSDEALLPTPSQRPIPDVLPESPVRTTGGETPYIPPIKNGRPNPEFVKNIPPPPPPRTGGETPLPESPIKSEIDKIIEESNEVITQIESKVDPNRRPVDPVQDVIKPPPAITPTEVALENQKDCENRVVSPTIEINNEVVVDLGQDQTQGVDVVIPDPIVVEEIRRGCTDPDAINYDPAATLDDGTCVFTAPDTGEPIEVVEEEPPPNIPPITDFVDSHGRTVFTVTIEDVIDEEVIELESGVKLDATVELVEDMIRPNLTDSDLILSEEDIEVTKKKTAREEIGGELASDKKLDSEKDVIVRGNREKLEEELIRNDNGLIMLKPDDAPKLKVSLRSQAFTFTQYRRQIDTEFSKLVGKM